MSHQIRLSARRAPIARDFAKPFNRHRFLTWRGLSAGAALALFLIACIAAEFAAAEAVVGFLTNSHITYNQASIAVEDLP